MPVKAADQIKEEILETIQTKFKFQVHSTQPIERGYRNLKWKMETDQGRLFVKQYNPIRYTEESLIEVKKALFFQAQLYDHGIPCPKLYTDQGEYILFTPSGERFVIMGFCLGELVNPGKVNVQQMLSFGEVTGRMHSLLNRSADTHQAPSWTPSPSIMLEKWKQNWEKAQEKEPQHILDVIEQQRVIIDELDMSLFTSCEQGWTHWDLWVDNLLFHEDKVAAIIDFDRLKYLYPEMDVARAILSCALDEGEMRLDVVSAFLGGYRKTCDFPNWKLIRSLKLLWCLEALIWLQPKTKTSNKVTTRFAEELIWLTQHWFELEKILEENI